MNAFRRLALSVTLPLVALAAKPGVALAQTNVNQNVTGDSISVRLVDVELRAALQALTPFLDRAVIIGQLPQLRVSVETPTPIARTAVAQLLRGILDANGLVMTVDSAAAVYRVVTKESLRPQPLATPIASSAQSSPHLEVFVIRLKHAVATEVAATVNALYGRASAFGELGERPATLSAQLTRQQVAVDPAAPVPPGQPAASTARLAGETTIIPDSRANSLLVRASRVDFDLIKAAVEQLDVRPLQVLIMVHIAEVRRDRTLDIGVDVSLPPTHIPGTENTTVQGTLQPSTGLGDLVVRVMGIHWLDIDATIRAAEARGDARIINRPILLAANNERAEINVGSQRPFVQVARVLPTDNTARDQVIQYKDVGTKLSIVPTISFEGYVMLQVLQEINAATAEQQFNAPVISTRSVETRLLVKDGQTIVLGGLTDMQKETVKSGVPLLARLPLLGALAGRHTTRRNETELLVFLTPKIIRQDADADSLTAPLKKRANRLEP